MLLETWVSIVGYEGLYEISDLGRVRSLQIRGLLGGIMTATRTNRGYYVIGLMNDGVKKQHRLHCLVLTAFVGPRPAGMQGCHGRDDKSDNTLSNLRWDTPKSNIAERQSFNGELNPNAKLSDAQTIEIRDRRLAGELLKTLAAEFGVSGVRISQIARA